MFVNKLHIGCYVAYAQGNKQRDAGCVRCKGSIMTACQITSLCYFCTGDADPCFHVNISCKTIPHLHLKAYFLTSGKLLHINELKNA